MKITKKTEDRIKAALPKFQKVLGIAKGYSDLSDNNAKKDLKKLCVS